MRVLVTGSSGFTGNHLCKHLLDLGVSVYGIDRKVPDEKSERSEERFQLFVGDLLDKAFLKDVLKVSEPSHVIHLAGVVGHSTSATVLHRGNVTVTQQLLELLHELGQSPRVVVVSSSAVYGHPITLPIEETHRFRPYTHYAVSKIAQEMVALHYYLCCNMPVIRARTFNLIGPGLSEELMPSAFASQVVLAELGASNSLHVGNLSPKRDFVDVRDAARAYVLLAALGEPGEVYNVCSGTAHSIRECVEVLTSLATVSISVETEVARQRKVEVADQVGSYARLHALSDWRPRIPFAKSWSDLLDDWRARVAKEEEKI